MEAQCLVSRKVVTCFNASTSKSSKVEKVVVAVAGQGLEEGAFASRREKALGLEVEVDMMMMVMMMMIMVLVVA
jgi:hypothetical protein